MTKVWCIGEELWDMFSFLWTQIEAHDGLCLAVWALSAHEIVALYAIFEKKSQKVF